MWLRCRGTAGIIAVSVVRPDDRIVIKLLAGPIIDLVDAAMVLRGNRDAIDVQRLERSVKEFGPAADYERILQEAFPGDAETPVSLRWCGSWGTPP